MDVAALLAELYPDDGVGGDDARGSGNKDSPAGMAPATTRHTTSAHASRGHARGDSGPPGTVAEFALALVPWLGGGVVELMTQPAPPAFRSKDAFRLCTPPSAASAAATAGTGDGSGGGHGAGVTSRSGAHIIRTPATLAAASRHVLRGTFLRASDAVFMRAVLALPASRLLDAGAVHWLCCHAPPPPSTPAHGVEVAQPPLPLLPAVPRPTFAHFFGTPGAHASPPPTITWPSSWVQYHATQCVLLLEEMRAMVANECSSMVRTVQQHHRRHHSHHAHGRGGVGGGSGGGGGAVQLWGSVANMHASSSEDGTISGGGGTGLEEYVLTLRSHASEVACLIACDDRRDGDAKPGSRFQVGGGGEGNAAPHPGTARLVRTSVGEVLRMRRDRVWNTRDLVLVTCTTVSTAPTPTTAPPGRGTRHDAPSTAAPDPHAMLSHTCIGVVVHTGIGGGDGGGERVVDDRRPAPTSPAFQAAIRIAPSPAMLHALSHGRHRWCVTGITSSNMVSVAYQSVVAVSHTPFASIVLAPFISRPHPLLRHPVTSPLPLASPLPPALHAALAARFDDSQMRVILTAATGGAYRLPACRIDATTGAVGVGAVTGGSSSSSSGVEVTSIIGPPGTGKTRTILGVISALRAVVAALPPGHLLAAQWQPAPSLPPSPPSPPSPTAHIPTVAILHPAPLVPTAVDGGVDALDGDGDDSSVIFLSDSSDKEEEEVPMVAPSPTPAPRPPSVEHASVGDVKVCTDADSPDDSDSEEEGGDGAGMSIAIDMRALRRRHTTAPASATAPTTHPAVGDKRRLAASGSVARVPDPKRPRTGGKDVVGMAGASTPQPRRARFLVCTPSNAACDEIVSRLMAEAVPWDRGGGTGGSVGQPISDGGAGGSNVDLTAMEGSHDVGGGLLDAEGRHFLPKVVRMGAGAVTSSRPTVWDCSAEVLAFRRLRELVVAQAQARGVSMRRPGEATVAPTPAVAAMNAQLTDLAPMTGWSLTALLRVPRHTTWPVKWGDHTFMAGVRPHHVTSTAAGCHPGGPLVGEDPHAAPLSPTSSPATLRRTSSAATTTTSERGGRERSHARRTALAVKQQRDELSWQDAFARALAALRLTRGQVSDLYHEAYVQVLEEADVVATTLSGAASFHNLRDVPKPLLATAPELCALLHGSTNLAAGGTARTSDADISFDAIIIDEAGQAVEAEALIPLRHAFAGYSYSTTTANEAGNGSWRPQAASAACRRLVLVGDPLQLPATVLSNTAARAGLEVSLFERIAGAGCRPLLLQRQYRMAGVISAFSSNHFYLGLVRDAAAVQHRVHLYQPPFMAGGAPAPYNTASHAGGSIDPCTAPLVALSVPWGAETQGDGRGAATGGDPSYGNDGEVSVVTALLLHMGDVLAGVGALPQIGIITPYREQVRRLRAVVLAALRHHPHLPPSRVRISTVDGFQGQELDVVVLSCVRSPPAWLPSKRPPSIGFLADARRLNVAVTRARHQLVLVGNLPYLAAADSHWAALIDYVCTHGVSQQVPNPASLAPHAAATHSGNGTMTAAREGQQPASNGRAVSVVATAPIRVACGPGIAVDARAGEGTAHSPPAPCCSELSTWLGRVGGGATGHGIPARGGGSGGSG